MWVGPGPKCHAQPCHWSGIVKNLTGESTSCESDFVKRTAFKYILYRP